MGPVVPRRLTDTEIDGSLLRQAPGPMYRELYRRVREGIVSGEMQPGYRLPSSRVLAAQLGVSRNTILLAYEQLEAEGYLETRRGSGHYVADVLPVVVERLGGARKRPTVAEPATGRPVANDFAFVSPLFRRAIPTVPFRPNLPAIDSAQLQTWIRMHIRALRQAGRSASHPGYLGETDAIGEPLLRRAISEYVSIARGVRCLPDQVIVTAGAQHAMDLVMRVLACPGELAWIEDPCFLGALAVLQGAGLEPVPIPVDREGIDLAVALTVAPRARFAVVCPSKQYPLGGAMSLRRRLALIGWARRWNAWIVEDDYDSEYRFSGGTMPSLQGLEGGEHVIYIGTFSKVLFPALRIGFIVAPPALVEPIVAARALAGRHGNPLDQQVLATFILEGHLGRHVRRMRDLYRSRMEALLQYSHRWLRGVVEIERADAGLQTIGWLTGGMDDQRVSLAAARAGIQVPNVSRYCIETPRPPGLVFGFGAFSEQELENGVQALARVLETIWHPSAEGEREASVDASYGRRSIQGRAASNAADA
jgi:GntR family transcriptional regulator / MocR family aminotransferase